MPTPNAKNDASARAARSTRRTVKSVDYSKEQQFSDDDIFEDSLAQDKVAKSLPTPVSTGRRGRPGRPRKSTNFDPDTVTNFSSVAKTGYVEQLQGNAPRYTERGYDPSLPSIRDRYLYEPEYEPDGSPKIELIVGRRPIEEKKSRRESNTNNEDIDEDVADESSSDDEESEKEVESSPKVKRKRGRPRKNPSPEPKAKKEAAPIPMKKHVEYEYLVKYKGTSYLHLEWKSGSDLDSMNKSAKTLYRRFLKKVKAGGDENLEDPTVDDAYVTAQKIVDEKDQIRSVELSDKELVAWERKRERELADEMSSTEDEKPTGKESSEDTKKSEEKLKSLVSNENLTNDDGEEKKAPEGNDEEDSDIDIDDDDGIPKMEKIRKILNKEGPYYPIFEGCDNPYRDGYLTHPPKKPRVSFLFFQCSYRSQYHKKYKGATQAEIMTLMRDTWRSMSEEEQAPFLQLAQEEANQFDKERIMMEKAQRPNGLWQPIRRCHMVLDRLTSDSYSTIFLEPVNLDDFPDYEEAIDQPMDLGTVRKKLGTKKYQAPEIFARDMRKVWNNCKIYNQHGSAIWHVADYMSKQFERLYQAWVLNFRERYLRWINPKARPWEQTCRFTDGKCGTSDDKMVMCDHCDSMYGMACLKPRLRKLPKGVWHCPECIKFKHENPGTRMLSAINEQAARKRAELGGIPKKDVRRKMFLVKWSGLGYENCTWELPEDIENKSLIEEYRRLNNMVPDEPTLKVKDVEEVLEKAKHVSVENAKGSAYIPDLRAQLYAQCRALQFTKFGMDVPKLLGKECGSKMCANATCNDECSDESSNHSNINRQEVISCINEVVSKVVRGEKCHSIKLRSSLPPLLTGEYDAVIPITEKGLMMNVGEIHGSVSFLGYREFPDGRKGPAELANLIRNVGDKIIAVDGVTTVNKTFQQVIQLLRKSGKNKFAYMRFLEMRYGVCSSDLTSMGRAGQFILDDIPKRLKTERRTTLVKRKQKTDDENNEENNDEDSDDSVGTHEVSDDDSEGEDSEGDLVADGDDYELVLKERMRQHVAPLSTTSVVSPEKTDDSNPEATPQATPSMENTIAQNEGNNSPAMEEANGITKEHPDTVESSKSLSEDASEIKKEHGSLEETVVGDENKDTKEVQGSNEQKVVEEKPTVFGSNGEMTPPPEKAKFDENVMGLKANEQNPKSHSQENTRSLGVRLLDIDMGYSSDEGVCEDSAFFMDGVDLTFSSMKSEEGSKIMKSTVSDSPEKSEKIIEDAKDKEAKTGVKHKVDYLPVKQNEFSTLGERSKIALSTILSRSKPCLDDFDQFPRPSKAVLEAEAKEKEAARLALEKARLEEEKKKNEIKKKSRTKVEQLSTINNDVLRVWASAEEASATLQISLKEIKQILNGEYNEDLGDEVGGFRWRYADEDAEVTKGASSGRDSKKGKQAFLEFRDKLYDHRHPYIYKDGHKLRDYQVDGVNWLASCWYKRHSCILADEMGLGKTVQIVTYVEHIHRVEKIQRPFLIVVPLSTVEHWRREFEGWTDMQCCIYHDRQREWRDVMREYEWYYEDRPRTPDYLKFDVLVTTYDTLISDYDILGQIPWRVTVVDEAHRLRNVKGKLLECMKQISARGTLQYGFQSRVLMTGTPLQNNTQELWTLLNFIEPYKFPSLDDFQSNYGNMANREQVESLQRKISPFMLRRVKEDVAKDIPAKEETLIDVELTSIQKQYYRAIFEHNHSFLSMGTNRATAPKLMNIQMELRKCCNHPFLLDGVETRELEKYHKELYEGGKIDDKSADEQQAMLNEHGYINTSGKMVLLNKLLPKLRQEGHKVLIFSQMVKMLDLISEFCDYKGFRHERLDGRVRGTERQKAIDRFETEEDSFVFLLSTRAGGVGINLTAADICIIFDSDWNPQNDVQAQARCHRIGQTKDVMIYRLITSRTFEQEMFDRASKKLGLEQAVLGTFGQDNDDGKPNAKEMEQLLKKGAYALLDDDNDQIGKEFCEDDIDNILAKRTRTRVVEGAKTSAWLNKSGLNVSKSKFTGDSAAATANVNVDDPLFWQKVMPDFVTPTIIMTKLKDIIKLVEKPNAVEGPGRGRKKKVVPKEDPPQEGKTLTESNEKTDTTIDSNNEEKKQPDEAEKKPSSGSGHPTRTILKKVSKFMNDLASMMEGIFEDAEDDNLPQSDKTICQNLLLMVSVKEKIFSSDQRMHARKLLKRLEGDRRRRCRTNGDEPGRFSKRNGDREEEASTNGVNSIPEELLILSKHKRRKRRQKEREIEREKNEEEKKSRRLTISPSKEQGSDDEDGFDSDSDVDSSDVGDDSFKARSKRDISRKEARRRRAWASDKAVGQLWPVFPRNVVNKVLKAMLEEVIKKDEEKGGHFSVPVPSDVFPEYYDVVKRPMDYGTMKKKLENGEYRSAQAMQKDFILVMQNCVQFNSSDSDIVKEARKQALRFPSLLKSAALKHNLFLAEDGSVLHVQSEDEDEYKDGEEGDVKPGKRGRKKKKAPAKRKYTRKSPALPRRSKKDKRGESSADLKDKPAPKKRGRKKKKVPVKEIEVSDYSNSEKSDDNDTSDSETKDSPAPKAKKPRIRISLNSTSDKTTGSAKRISKKRTRKTLDEQEKTSKGDDIDSDSQGEPSRSKSKVNEEDVVPIASEKIPKRKRKVVPPKPDLPKKKASDTDLEDGEIDDTDTKEKNEVKQSLKSPDDTISDEKNNANDEIDETDDPGKKHADITTIKKELGSLDGSLADVKQFVTRRGPWILPKSVSVDKWYTVAKFTLTKMKKHDGYRLFADKVTDDDAPGYSDVIKKPMDFKTMSDKLEEGSYGEGSEALTKLYSDYLLVFDNCAIYNDVGSEVADEAARVMKLLPEVFANACASVREKGKRGRKKKSKI